MAIFKSVKQQKTVKNANDMLDKLKHFNNLTLGEVDEIENFLDVRHATKKVMVDEDGNITSDEAKMTEERVIHNLIIVFKDKKGNEGDHVMFPFSRGLSMANLDEILANPEQLVALRFRINKTMKDGDVEGEPTGDPYISFGKAGGLTFDEVESLVPSEEEVNK